MHILQFMFIRSNGENIRTKHFLSEKNKNFLHIFDQIEVSKVNRIFYFAIMKYEKGNLNGKKSGRKKKK